jgi:hypothetical protein
LVLGWHEGICSGEQCYLRSCVLFNTVDGT